VVLYANQPKELYRFCNQCFKFEKLAAFDGTKRWEHTHHQQTDICIKYDSLIWTPSKPLL